MPFPIRLLPGLRMTALWVASCGLLAQDPAALQDTFSEAKALWANQGDRDAAAAKLEQVLQVLEPRTSSLDGRLREILCETYNWLAVLDDRSPAHRARVPKHLESLLSLDPNFELDKDITPARIQGQHDALRTARCAKIKMILTPPGGELRIGGRRMPPEGLRFLLAGKTAISYVKPGHRPHTQSIDLAPREARTIDLSLDRISSTVSVFTSPQGIEVLVDGRSVGRTSGRMPETLRELADKVSLRPDQVSGPFLLDGLTPGKHLLELRAPCFRTRKLELGEGLTQPFADHFLQPIKLEAAQGTLTVTSNAPGGELFLSAQSRGRLPADKLSVCEGAYDLVVKYPAGGFARKIQILDGTHTALAARPKPRLAFMGIEGSGDFPGKARLQEGFRALGERLTEAAWIPPATDESPAEALTRIQTAKDAELYLRAIPFVERGAHQVELVLSTLNGEEERSILKPMEQDPLGPLVARLNRAILLTEPWIGLTLLDVPGEPGPWVLEADAEALAAGIKPHQAIEKIGETPVRTVAEARKVLADLSGNPAENPGSVPPSPPPAKGDAGVPPAGPSAPGTIPVVQNGQAIVLSFRQAPREIPTQATELAYPLILADLRLRALGAQGPALGHLKLNQALALMHFRAYDKALERLREATLPHPRGLGQATVDFHTALCLGRLGTMYTAEAIQTLGRVQSSAESTFFGPDGPPVAPLARQASDELKP